MLAPASRRGHHFVRIIAFAEAEVQVLCQLLAKAKKAR